jgi:phosphatidylglycerol:prolipoprotein diacylglycerol transferase
MGGLIEGWDPIKIGIDPEIGKVGGLLLTWHGVFTAVGIAVGVWVAVQLAQRVGIIEDVGYTVALIAVPAGIIGARALYVIENYGDPGSGLHSVGDVFAINEGGISIFGAVLGGIIGAWAWGFWRKLPILKGSDAGATGLILGMGIGRIGDIINGEHLASSTNLPFGVVYTHANSISFGRPPQHLAVGYEMVGDLLIFLVLLALWRWYRRTGVMFFTFLLLYSLMRLGVSALRLDDAVWGELRMAQIVSVFLIPIAAIGLLYCLRRAPEVEPEPVEPEPVPATGRQRVRR